MSKCDISIEFYRPDREFQTGQSVQGWVRIKVDKDIKCRGLSLNVFWKTHGRGNTSRQNYFQQNLFQGQWLASESYEYPFEFTPPISPQTYHGHYLNIDHYVSVRADIPWALDPRREEEFLWRVGSEAEELSQQQAVLEQGRGCANVGLAFSVAAAIAVIVTAVVVKSFWLLLILLPLLFIGFLCLRDRLAERKLGSVTWATLGSTYAGQAMPCSLHIGPVSRVQIKEITAVTEGSETVVSGSGTDATTYTHELFKKKTVIASSPSIALGASLELQPEILFPETDAFSIDLPDNKIRWNVTLAIRLAGWPDWVQSREIRLIGSPKVTTSENPNPAFHTRSLLELIELAKQLTKHGNDGTQVDQTIAEHAEDLFTVALEVQKSKAAASNFDDPEYAGGRTLEGSLQGTEVVVSLQLPARYNEQIDSLVRGSTWNSTAAIIRWDALQKRLTMLGIQGS